MRDMTTQNTQKTKHTPGPWSVKESGSHIYVVTFNDSIALVDDAANAQLIAAAPDMLAALKAIVADLSQPVQRTPNNGGIALVKARVDVLRGDCTAARNTALAAIIKATGACPACGEVIDANGHCDCGE